MTFKWRQLVAVLIGCATGGIHMIAAAADGSSTPPRQTGTSSELVVVKKAEAYIDDTPTQAPEAKVEPRPEILQFSLQKGGLREGLMEMLRPYSYDVDWQVPHDYFVPATSTFTAESVVDAAQIIMDAWPVDITVAPQMNLIRVVKR